MRFEKTEQSAEKKVSESGSWVKIEEGSLTIFISSKETNTQDRNMKGYIVWIIYFWLFIIDFLKL